MREEDLEMSPAFVVTVFHPAREAGLRVVDRDEGGAEVRRHKTVVCELAFRLPREAVWLRAVEAADMDLDAMRFRLAQAEHLQTAVEAGWWNDRDLARYVAARLDDPMTKPDCVGELAIRDQRPRREQREEIIDHLKALPRGSWAGLHYDMHEGAEPAVELMLHDGFGGVHSEAVSTISDAVIQDARASWYRRDIRRLAGELREYLRNSIDQRLEREFDLVPGLSLPDLKIIGLLCQESVITHAKEGWLWVQGKAATGQLQVEGMPAQDLLERLGWRVNPPCLMSRESYAAAHADYKGRLEGQPSILRAGRHGTEVTTVTIDEPERIVESSHRPRP